MRQLAWLRTAAKDQKVPRSYGMTTEEIEAELPEVFGFGYVLDLLFSVGVVVFTGTGVQSIGWPDIAAYSDLTGMPLSSWESSTIKRLSDTYASAVRLYDSSLIGRPYSRESDDEKIAAGIKSALGALRK
tara:strand:+ start:1586 stop:1975 length:390 start_codon:yes stop_codon:yes gene_type:complete